MGMLTAAAAVSVVVAAVIGGDPDVAERIRAADDVLVFELESPLPAARIVYSSEVGRAMFVGEGLEAPGPQHTYQLWLLDDDGPRSAGTFQPEGGGATVVLDGTAETGSAVGLSVEPAGGSPQPTTRLLFTQPLS